MPLGRRPGINSGWAAAILVLLIGALSLWRLNATLEVSRTAERIETTLDTMEDALSRLKDAETGQRGYILTGDTSYLEPYRTALDGLRADLGALARFTERRPVDRRRVDALTPLIDRRLAEIDTTIALRRSGFEAAVTVVRTNAGKRSMDSVRAAIADLEASEHERLADARRGEERAVRVAVILILGGTLAAFGLALFAQALVGIAAGRMRQVAADLSATNAELEVKTRAADAASQAKSDFLAIMSHELRTPLNAALGHATLLADGIGGPITPSQAIALGRIQNAVKTLVGLIDEVLTYARLGRGTETVELREIDLCETVRDVIALVEHVFELKGLALTFNEPDAPCVVTTDPLKVGHVLLNLLTNAAKFTRTGAASVTMTATADSVIVEVSDTGIGISPENQKRIFEPFVQGDQGRARAAEGAGLGLSIARRLAGLLGGELTLTSTIGRGSTFTLRLPRDGAVSTHAGHASGIGSRPSPSTPMVLSDRWQKPR